MLNDITHLVLLYATFPIYDYGKAYQMGKIGKDYSAYPLFKNPRAYHWVRKWDYRNDPYKIIDIIGNPNPLVISLIEKINVHTPISRDYWMGLASGEDCYIDILGIEQIIFTRNKNKINRPGHVYVEYFPADIIQFIKIHGDYEYIKESIRELDISKHDLSQALSSNPSDSVGTFLLSNTDFIDWVFFASNPQALKYIKLYGKQNVCPEEWLFGHNPLVRDIIEIIGIPSDYVSFIVSLSSNHSREAFKYLIYLLTQNITATTNPDFWIKLMANPIDHLLYSNESYIWINLISNPNTFDYVPNPFVSTVKKMIETNPGKYFPTTNPSSDYVRFIKSSPTIMKYLWANKYKICELASHNEFILEDCYGPRLIRKLTYLL